MDHGCQRPRALLLAVLTLTMLTAAAFAEDTEVLGVYNVTGPLTVTNGTGVGAKAGFGHQMKSTTAEVIPYRIHTESGEKVDAIFSYRSVANRGVLSPSIIGTTITLLDACTKKAVDIYEGV